ncbi:uncharacterized protein FFB20_08688 [Fusarium fujikuroi]|nr:uncharacterized protein Y057_1443 [Fusarium fujikuroi]QGI76707.1 hypothetical protein CEK25_001613 [Fusarium fujikuroi]SCN66356.1 uncharacterized protein FFE2_00414 [Fusarium fujikuroi]SCN69275.1 uncharacterized protein FFC1_00410 [Fusarium fujikuroi]SCN90356.1 uncharacterized protein FFB20_08688 [Fusarium fujikuroi]
MSVLAPRIPVAIYLYRQDPNSRDASPSPSASSTPSKRRSVSSMTGLLPLALPASRSETPSILDEEVIDDMMDCFPEVLARDLERSSSVFMAKNMTAGMPSAPVWFAEDQVNRGIMGPSRIITSPYQSGSVRVQNLGSIEERKSMVSFLEHRGQDTDEIESDEESESSEYSEAIEVPSIKLREQSIVTTATSLTSASGNPPSPKDLLSPTRGQEYSWIDVDSDSDDDDDELEPQVREQLATPKETAALSPRPPTPPNTEPTFDITVMMEAPRPRLHGACSCIDESPKQSKHKRQFSVKSMDAPTIPPRKTSLTSATDPLDTTPRIIIPSFDSRIGPDSQGYTKQSPSYTQRFRDETDNNTILLKSDFGSIELEIEDQDTFMDKYPPPPPLSRPDTVYIEQTPPPSPLPTVESWLADSNPPCLPQIPVDDLAKAVPLPPDIIETLRVSIACFPETMLLSSSLTTETIRTYSKKVRQPSVDAWSEPANDSSTLHPRKSIWKKVVSHGRDSASTRRQRLHLYDSNTHSGAAASPVPWASLRHVFSGCSDYICDALYAHIVAYNYVSRVPRNQPSGQRASTPDSKQQGENIPKKAASLLGLGTPQVNPSPSVGRFAKKLSAPLTVMGFGKEETSTATVQDNATRNIESGLLRCISRLVATARMISEGGAGEERLMDTEPPQEVDMIFVRSICEIVRLSEETS